MPKNKLNNKGTSRKSPKAVVELRTNEIYNLLLSGYSRQDILQYTAENYKINERSADGYIKKATERIKTLYSDDIKETILERHLAMKYQLYQRLNEEEDYKGANSILDSIEKMLGVGGVNKQEITIKTEQPLFGDD